MYTAFHKQKLCWFGINSAKSVMPSFILQFFVPSPPTTSFYRMLLAKMFHSCACNFVLSLYLSLYLNLDIYNCVNSMTGLCFGLQHSKTVKVWDTSQLTKLLWYFWYLYSGCVSSVTIITCMYWMIEIKTIHIPISRILYQYIFEYLLIARIYRVAEWRINISFIYLVSL